MTLVPLATLGVLAYASFLLRPSNHGDLSRSPRTSGRRSSGHDQLGLNPSRIRADLADATPHGYSTQFGDYLTMFRALADPQQALRTARTLPDSTIDDGDSRSYLLAWTLVHAEG